MIKSDLARSETNLKAYIDAHPEGQLAAAYRLGRKSANLELDGSERERIINQLSEAWTKETKRCWNTNANNNLPKWIREVFGIAKIKPEYANVQPAIDRALSNLGVKK
jgi:hypothetical protein